MQQTLDGSIWSLIRLWGFPAATSRNIQSQPYSFLHLSHAINKCDVQKRRQSNGTHVRSFGSHELLLDCFLQLKYS